MHQFAELLPLFRYEGVVVRHGLGAGDGDHYIVLVHILIGSFLQRKINLILNMKRVEECNCKRRKVNSPATENIRLAY
jgi:hypothetical protein